MGALGDWGAHILDTVHEFLQLGLPYEINMLYANKHNEFFYPYSSTILFRFGARGNMPPCDVTWYDGVDNLPPLPAGYGESELGADIPASNQGEYTKQKINPGKIICFQTGAWPQYRHSASKQRWSSGRHRRGPE